MKAFGGRSAVRVPQPQSDEARAAEDRATQAGSNQAEAERDIRRVRKEHVFRSRAAHCTGFPRLRLSATQDLDVPASGNEMKNENHQGDDEQQVDEPAGDVKGESAAPE